MKVTLEMRTEIGGVLDTFPLGEPDTYGDFKQPILDCIRQNDICFHPGDILEIKEEVEEDE